MNPTLQQPLNPEGISYKIMLNTFHRHRTYSLHQHRNSKTAHCCHIPPLFHYISALVVAHNSTSLVPNLITPIPRHASSLPERSILKIYIVKICYRNQDKYKI